MDESLRVSGDTSQGDYLTVPLFEMYRYMYLYTNHKID